MFLSSRGDSSVLTAARGQFSTPFDSQGVPLHHVSRSYNSPAFTPREVIGWVFFPRAVLPLCRRRICLYFCDPVTNKYFPSAWIASDPNQHYLSVGLLRGVLESPFLSRGRSNAGTLHLPPQLAAPDGVVLLSSLEQVCFYCSLV